MTGGAATAIPPEFATPGAQFWEIAADGGDLWDEWREGGLVGIGWDHLGDMTGLDKKGFRAKASDALAKGKRGVWQLWRLVHDMKVGDVVLVRAGWSAILGIGVITGAYHFAPEDKYHYCHRRPVRWLTTQPRLYAGRRRQTLCEIGAAEATNVWLSEAIEAPVATAPVGASVAARVAVDPDEPLNLILHGPPGTGKTWALKERAARLIGVPADSREEVERAWAVAQERGQVELVTFHPSMSYEEFVEGLRPVLAPGDDQIRYEVVPGLFTRIARRAIAAAVPADDLPDDADTASLAGQEALGEQALREDWPLDFGPDTPRFVLVIDEINRANIARVFGELITLLEDDKRLGAGDPLVVSLPGSKSRFAVPRNLHVIATMNTSDRSVALIDVALRRRFAFEELRPDSEKLREALPGKPGEVAVAVLEALNARLELMLDREHLIGHAWFMKATTLENLREVMARKVIPLLQEYFHGAPDRLALVLGHPCDSDGRPSETKGRSWLTVTRLGKECFGSEVVDIDDIVDVEISPWVRSDREANPGKAALDETLLELDFARLIRGAKP